MSPMMQHYLEIKKQYSDYIVFYRLGDFYEMFFEDAKIVSKELELVLTGRDCGEDERAPMCGIPYHACDVYIGRLVEKGYKVVVCEQMETPAQAQGNIVRRDIVRIVTPGTLTDGKLLDESKNNYLCALNIYGLTAACAFCDISRAMIELTTVNGSDEDELFQSIINELSLFKPSEVIINAPGERVARLTDFLSQNEKCSITASAGEYFIPDQALIKNQFPDECFPEGFSISGTDGGACAAIIRYISETQKTSVPEITEICAYGSESFMSIDASTRRNLELCETLRTKERRGSLLWVLDKTKTSPGARLMRKFIEQPLVNCRAVQLRQGAVAEFFSHTILRDDVRAALSGAQDLERLFTKVQYGTSNARDLIAIKQTLSIFPKLEALLCDTSASELSSMYNSLRTELGEKLGALYDFIDRAITDDPPFLVREGGLIKKGFNSDVDELRSMVTESREYLSQIESQEKELTGIKGLKIGYTKVFGYYIEITKSNIPLVPDRYIRKQTLTNCERFITRELKDMESRILGANDKSIGLEYELYLSAVENVKSYADAIFSAAGILAKTDVYAALAEVALKNNYVCPEVDYSDLIELKNSRHPVVEKFTNDYFVPNDVSLDCGRNRTMIITGPNMAGKSTYMRQVALIVLMAQIGSFVPAEEARIGICDRLFTRIGASDDLSSGSSTFMVEMNEVAYILKHATKKSLIIYDEIGRGTSTYDGMSIARAVLEYTTGKKLGAKTMFATHYHELSELENSIDGVKNYNIAAKKRGDSVTFLRKIVRGSADDSYGIEVAQLAGVPAEVIRRARQILKKLEEENANTPVQKTEAVIPEISLFDSAKNILAEELKSIDVNTLTPIEAMGKLYELTKKAKEL
ncbi:MAG: DNA mismatch repair protein MutS [Oscillospiraceae bacterium]|nr:DNA mismatch repair protein MutS [Oscillospiraceae bacterium]